MQLFITQFILQGDQDIVKGDIVLLEEERVVYQIKHVLRGKIGMQFWVQLPYFPNGNMSSVLCSRYLVEIMDIQKQKLVCRVIDIKEKIIEYVLKKICIALPNKFEKIELIVQKISELGLQYIIFFPGQYSQLHELGENKIQRLKKIAWEAIEQSYGFILPEIIFEKHIENILQQGKNIQLHQDGIDIKNILYEEKKYTHFFVGPEGGWGEKDEKIFLDYQTQKVNLGKTILRTETASIITAWEAINHMK